MVRKLKNNMPQKQTEEAIDPQLAAWLEEDTEESDFGVPIEVQRQVIRNLVDGLARNLFEIKTALGFAIEIHDSEQAAALRKQADGFYKRWKLAQAKLAEMDDTNGTIAETIAELEA